MTRWTLFVVVTCAACGCASAPPPRVDRAPHTISGANARVQGVTVRLQLKSGVLYPRVHRVRLEPDVTTFISLYGNGQRDTVATPEIARIYLPPRGGDMPSAVPTVAGAVPGLVLAGIALSRPSEAESPGAAVEEALGRAILVAAGVGLAVLGAAIGHTISNDRPDPPPTVLYRAPDDDGALSAQPAPSR